MKLTLTTHSDLVVIVTKYFKEFRKYVPDTTLKWENSDALKYLISSVASMLKRRYSYLEVSEVENILQRGIEGEFDSSLKSLSVPKIYKWFQAYQEKEHRRKLLESEQTHYRHKEHDKPKPAPTYHGAACTFIMLANIGRDTSALKEWRKLNDIRELPEEEINFILKYVQEETIKQCVIEQTVKVEV